MIKIIEGDALKQLKALPDNSVDSVVTDPPYGLSNIKPDKMIQALSEWVSGNDTVVPQGRGFMGKAWDGFVPPPAVWKECYRVLKPGGHIAVFAGTRTQDLMGLSIRLAGFEIRDTLGWVYGSGFPKSMDVSKAIDKAAGAEREVVGKYTHPATGKPHGDFRTDNDRSAYQSFDMCDDTRNITAPATPEAKQWDGWGTALKPAIEPIILARKPLDGTVAQNVLAHGVGGLNIDACRVGATVETWPKSRMYGGNPSEVAFTKTSGDAVSAQPTGAAPAGRFPANVLLDEHAAAEMDKQSGWSVSRRAVLSSTPGDIYGGGSGLPSHTGEYGHNDSGGASRFFPVFKYQAKAPKKERPVIEREDGTKIQHPTVKPVALMEWLVTLITPPGGTILDPFAGTGTTLQAARNKGFNAIGVEREADYIQLIEKRLSA